MFKRRHEFNRKIRNGKRLVKIFPAGGDLPILPRKFLSMVRSKGMFFSEKRMCCATDAKLEDMLGEIYPIATPITEDSGMSLNEQSNTPGENFGSSAT